LGAGLILILDFDGTLAPLVPRPAEAVLDPEVRRRLRRLAAHPRVRLAIVSGRSLSDIRRRVGLKRVVYGGCHGLEIRGPGLGFRHPVSPSVRRGLAMARRLVNDTIAHVPGIDVEWKRLALAVHYRGVSASRLRVLFRRIKEVSARAGLALLLGEKVWDLVPPGHRGKSSAVRLIRDRLRRELGGRVFTLFAGDDVTDADAFVALRERGIAVQVGRSRGAADYHLRGVREIHTLLSWIADRGLASRSARSKR